MTRREFQRVILCRFLRYRITVFHPHCRASHTPWPDGFASVLTDKPLAGVVLNKDSARTGATVS